MMDIQEYEAIKKRRQWAKEILEAWNKTEGNAYVYTIFCGVLDDMVTLMEETYALSSHVHYLDQRGD